MITLEYERTMKYFFGKKADNIAGGFNNTKERKKWLQKAIKYMIKNVNALDAPINLKKNLLSHLENLKVQISNFQDPNWHLTILLFSFCARLLGLNHKGHSLYSLCYWQDQNQKGTEMIEDLMYLSSTKKNVLSLKHDLIKKLKSDGYDDFTIALTFNTSEFEIKKIARG